MTAIRRIAGRAAALVLGLMIVVSLTPAARAAEETPLATGWRFIKQDVSGAEASGFDDSAWTEVRVPHTYNAGDSGIGGARARGEPEGEYYRGPAWYRLDLQADPAEGRRYYLHFGGATLRADVWLNGERVGVHEGGYAAFRFDVTDQLRAGDNVLAVRVDNARNVRYAPLNGDFNIFGGLYREVKLIETDDLHVDLTDHGGLGVYASTTELGDDSADIATRVRVRNAGEGARDFEILTRILDADGREVATARTPGSAAPGQIAELEQAMTIEDPTLWAGRGQAYLYRVATQVLFGGDVIDETEVPLGVRTIAVTEDGRVWLNGETYQLYGANLQHPVRYGRGPIVTDAEIEEDMRLMYEMGVTGLRLAHMQHPPYVYEVADRMGIVLVTEVPLVDNMDDADTFRENLVQQMRELISQHYNNPSVGFWGIGNELRTSGEYANRLMAALQATAREMDPLRPTTYAHCCLDDDDPIALHSDTVSYNRYFGWYWDTSAEIGPWADELHARMPTRPIGVSEYGAGASILHQEDPVLRRPVADGYWHPEQWQTQFHIDHWRLLRERSFLWSNFIWLGIDFPSFKRNEGDRPAINDKGLVTEDRQTRKDAYFWYQANWYEEPVLHITSRRDVNKRTRRVTVRAFSNEDVMWLRLNGGDWTEVAVDDHIAEWTIDLADGENLVEAVIRPEGREPVTDEVRWNYITRP